MVSVNKLLNFDRPLQSFNTRLISVDFTKKRWIHLKECFFKDVTLMRRDPKASSLFKHFNHMLFLCKNASISKTMVTDSVTFKTDGQQLSSTIPDEDIEFSITQDDIDACEDDDEDIFVELSSDELELAVQQRDVSDSFPTSTTNNITADVIAASIVVPTFPQKRKAEPKEVSVAKVEALPVHSDEPIVSPEPPSKQTKHTVARQTETSAREPSKSEHRCEDIIFGELVAAMLQKMESGNKKSAKRKIMDILLDF